MISESQPHQTLISRFRLRARLQPCHHSRKRSAALAFASQVVPEGEVAFSPL
jgi:hypothetical protein